MNMKLFSIFMESRLATAVARDKNEVLALIPSYPEIKRCFSDSEGNLLPANEITKHISEIPDFTVQGNYGSILGWYRTDLH